jgi:hypothetical protein
MQDESENLPTDISEPVSAEAGSESVAMESNTTVPEVTEQEHTAIKIESNQRSLLDRFSDSLSSSTLLNSIKITPSGLFVTCEGWQNFLETFQSWLKIDTGSESLLDLDRCSNLICTSDSKHSSGKISYYILDGKNCRVGYLVPAKPLDSLRNKFPHYAGTPIDGRKSIHPKDPILNQLPPELKVDSQRLYIKGNKFSFSIPFEDLSLLRTILGGSPKLKKYRSEFNKALRDILVPLSKFILSGQIIEKSKLRLIPSVFRKQSNIIILRFSDVFLVTDSTGVFKDGFGLKAKNFFDFVSIEINSLARSLRNRRIGNFEIETRSRHIAGVIRLKNEKFFVETKIILEWAQDFKSAEAQPATLYDAILSLSNDFCTSDWILERDVPARFKVSTQTNSKSRSTVNYRCSKERLYSLDKKAHILAIHEWTRPKQKNIEIIIPSKIGDKSEPN